MAPTSTKSKARGATAQSNSNSNTHNKSLDAVRGMFSALPALQDSLNDKKESVSGAIFAAEGNLRREIELRLSTVQTTAEQQWPAGLQMGLDEIKSKAEAAWAQMVDNKFNPGSPAQDMKKYGWKGRGSDDGKNTPPRKNQFYRYAGHLVDALASLLNLAIMPDVDGKRPWDHEGKGATATTSFYAGGSGVQGITFPSLPPPQNSTYVGTATKGNNNNKKSNKSTPPAPVAVAAALAAAPKPAEGDGGVSQQQNAADDDAQPVKPARKPSNKVYTSNGTEFQLDQSARSAPFAKLASQALGDSPLQNSNIVVLHGLTKEQNQALMGERDSVSPKFFKTKNHHYDMLQHAAEVQYKKIQAVYEAGRDADTLPDTHKKKRPDWGQRILDLDNLELFDFDNTKKIQSAYKLRKSFVEPKSRVLKAEFTASEIQAEYQALMQKYSAFILDKNNNITITVVRVTQSFFTQASARFHADTYVNPTGFIPGVVNGGGNKKTQDFYKARIAALVKLDVKEGGFAAHSNKAYHKCLKAAQQQKEKRSKAGQVKGAGGVQSGADSVASKDATVDAQ